VEVEPQGRLTAGRILSRRREIPDLRRHAYSDRVGQAQLVGP
jgi:hypothetical protein